ncbi:putative uncharacterized protein precursor [Sphingomonas paucimobilis]|nr:putative uncharacterized protein precursor [Sphingomonas paucimobilis]
MIRVLTLSMAMLISLPAAAQQASSPQTEATAPSAPSATPASPADSIASIVDTEFPAYDANSDNQLDKSEFSRWMVALKGQEMKTTGKTLAPAEITAWADGAFATADADKSTTVSKAELISYLSGGA